VVRDYDSEFDFYEEGEHDIEEAVKIKEWVGGQWVIVRENVWATDFRE
jgi:hypothetical protein